MSKTRPEDVLRLIASRHSTRAFRDRPVPRPLLAAVLAAAANAPSSRNTQPWAVAVLRGEARDALAARLQDAFDRGVPPEPQFLNNPSSLSEPFAGRARATGAGLFDHLGIARDDGAARRAHLRRNLDFYGAPVALIFHLPGDAVPGSFLALGCFLQNVMLGLLAHGVGSCPQYSVAGYPALIKEHLGIDAERIVVCAMAVGYPDGDAPINRYVPERAPLDDYADWWW
ncbi:MAG: nitroreductase [Acidobacteria bacterium]|nr:MAG: nitroreductase [Acidobacteriota bacterium]